MSGLSGDARVEVVARAMARAQHGPMCDLDMVVEFGAAQAFENTPSGTVYGPRPFSAPLWVLYTRLARIALDQTPLPSLVCTAPVVEGG